MASLSIPPIEDPNFPKPPAPATVDISTVFNNEQVEFLQSVLLYYEEYTPYGRENITSLNLLEQCRAILGGLHPS